MTSATGRTLTHVGTKDERETAQRPLNLSIIVRLLGYTRAHAAKRNWLLLCVMMRATQGPILAAMIGWTINHPIKNGDFRGIVLAAGIYGLLALITQLTLHFRLHLSYQLGELVIHDLRRELFAKIQALTMSYFDTTKLGRIISRFTSDAEAVRTGVQDVMFVTIVNGGQMLVAAAFMIYYDAILFGLVLALAPVLYSINRYFRARLSKVFREVQESMSRVTATLAESVSGIRVTQGFAREDVNADMFRELVADHSEYNMNVSRTTTLFLQLLDLNSQFFIASLLLVGGYQALNGTLSVGNLVEFFFMANLFFAPVNGLGSMYNAALTAMAGAERVFKLLDNRPNFADPPHALELPPINGQVEFRDLSFEYVEGKPVLNEINFIAEPGQTIALVGHTGSGKSSIINLISKFYLPTDGELLIDGYDIRGVSADSLHRQMGIVLQQNFLFSGTVMDNIRVGKPDASDEQIIDAARRLDCLDMIEDLPNGFYNEVGERGGSLSLGQRQLVCFTRAMLADPRILILDEATSSVDTMTEARIQRALEVLLAGRTSFVVAHRLSTIRHADVVLVLDHGWIVERGSHKQLLATGGIYANLYRQFIRATEA